jgi:hypothetical protein
MSIEPTSPADLARPSDRDLEIFRKVAVEGHCRSELAKEYSLSERSIRHVLRKTQQWVAARFFTPDSPEVRSLHLQRLEHQWEEVMVAWYRSQLPLEMTRTWKDDKGRTGAQVVRRMRTGEPRYLEHARRILADIRRLGADGQVAPSALEMDYVDVATLTPEQRRAEFVQLLDALRERARVAEGNGTDLRPPDPPPPGTMPP